MDRFAQIYPYGHTKYCLDSQCILFCIYIFYLFVPEKDIEKNWLMYTIVIILISVQKERLLRVAPIALAHCLHILNNYLPKSSDMLYEPLSLGENFTASFQLEVFQHSLFTLCR